MLANFIVELFNIVGDGSSDRLWILETDGSSKRVRGIGWCYNPSKAS